MGVTCLTIYAVSVDVIVSHLYDEKRDHLENWLDYQSHYKANKLG